MAIIFLDQEKAYDLVEWGYFEKGMNKFGVGSKFTQSILMLKKCGKVVYKPMAFCRAFFLDQ